VCKVLAALYKQPKAEYIEVGRSSKSFVLASKAWDSPMDTQVPSYFLSMLTVYSKNWSMLRFSQ